MRTLLAARPNARASVKIAAGVIVLRPVSLREIFELVRLRPSAKAVLGLGGEFGPGAESAAIAFMRASIVKPRWLAIWWVLRASSADRLSVLDAAISLSFAGPDIKAYHRPTEDDAKSNGPLMIGYGDQREDPLAQLALIATDLESAGHPDPWSLSPLQLIWRAMRLRDIARRDLMQDAVAARVAQADEKGWKTFVQDESN